MSAAKPLDPEPAPDPPAEKPASNMLAQGLRGRRGIGIATAIFVLGQATWLLPREGAHKLALADVFAIEGIVVAMAFGVLALAAAFQHAAALEGVADKLTDVADTVLTRTLGEFPQFVKDIRRLVEDAETSIRILCDNPAYAVVSDGDSFDEYLRALRSAIDRRGDGFVVELMFLDDKERKQLHGDQVARNLGAEAPAAENAEAELRRQEERWTAARNDRKALYTAFLERAHALCSPEDAKLENAGKLVDKLGFADYVKRLMDVNDEVLRRRLHGVPRLLLRFRDEHDNAQALQRGPSIYFWMRDEEEAIFAIVPLGSTIEEGLKVAAREIAFSTFDPHMIDALNGVFERYRRVALAHDEKVVPAREQ